MVKEGVALRCAGVERVILCVCASLIEEDAVVAVMHDLCLTAADAKSARIIRGACEKYSLKARVHLKINSGMNRYGADFESLGEIIGILSGCSHIEGIYSHFYDGKDPIKCDAQFSYFLRCARRVEGEEGPIIKHISATGGSCSERKIQSGYGAYRAGDIRLSSL